MKYQSSHRKPSKYHPHHQHRALAFQQREETPQHPIPQLRLPLVRRKYNYVEPGFTGLSSKAKTKFTCVSCSLLERSFLSLTLGAFRSLINMLPHEEKIHHDIPWLRPRIEAAHTANLTSQHPQHQRNRVFLNNIANNMHKLTVLHRCYME